VHSSVANLPESPEELAKLALKDGDRDTALTLLMETYGEEIYRHCRQVVGDSDVAADVHQTVFVQAYRDLTRERVSELGSTPSPATAAWMH
tara:strand:+ start:31468 stop:31740 length:273 start_codon:yes stop_codon:yes gene_type:complete